MYCVPNLILDLKIRTLEFSKNVALVVVTITSNFTVLVKTLLKSSFGTKKHQGCLFVCFFNK